MIIVGQNRRQKSHKMFLGKFGRNSGKIPSHPQKLACSYTYGCKKPRKTCSASFTWFQIILCSDHHIWSV